MSSRKKLDRLIEKAESDLAQLRKEVSAKENFIAGLQEARKLIPENRPVNSDAVVNLRPGSVPHKVYAVLKAKGRPLHIKEILKELGLEGTKQNRASVTGTLGSYVRASKIFTKPAPNTFGLFNFSADSSQAREETLGDFYDSDDDSSPSESEWEEPLDF